MRDLMQPSKSEIEKERIDLIVFDEIKEHESLAEAKMLSNNPDTIDAFESCLEDAYLFNMKQRIESKLITNEHFKEYCDNLNCSQSDVILLEFEEYCKLKKF